MSAQTNVEKGLQSINRSSAEAAINFLASDELQGREAGFHGSRVTSEYIVSLLQWMEYRLWLTAISSLLMLTVKNVRKKKDRLEVHPDSIAKRNRKFTRSFPMRKCIRNDSR